MPTLAILDRIMRRIARWRANEASTMISSRLREKELESFVIEDQRGAAQRLRALAGKPDGPRRVLLPTITNRIEGSPAREAMANDSRHPDLRASKLDRHHFDQADELIGIPRADLMAVLPNTAADRQLDIAAVWADFRELRRMRIEVIPIRRRDFEENRSTLGELAEAVAREGHVVYGR